MSVTAAIRRMLDAGLSLEQALIAAEAFEVDAAPKRSAAAIRQERYRRNKASQNATSDACDGGDVTVVGSLSPKESSPTPPKEITPYPQTPATPKGVAAPPAETDLAIQAYSEMAERSGLAVPRVVTAGRRAKVAGVLRQHGMPMWLEALARVEESDFLRGDNDRGWKADLEFILQPKSFAKLMDGSYGTQRPAARAAPAKPLNILDLTSSLIQEMEAENARSETNHRRDQQAPLAIPYRNVG